MRIPRRPGTKSGTPATGLNRDVSSPAARGSAAQPAIRHATESPSPDARGSTDHYVPAHCDPAHAARGSTPKISHIKNRTKTIPALRESTPARYRGPSALVYADHPFVVSHCLDDPKHSPPRRESPACNDAATSCPKNQYPTQRNGNAQIKAQMPDVPGAPGQDGPDFQVHEMHEQGSKSDKEETKMGMELRINTAVWSRELVNAAKNALRSLDPDESHFVYETAVSASGIEIQPGGTTGDLREIPARNGGGTGNNRARIRVSALGRTEQPGHIRFGGPDELSDGSRPSTAVPAAGRMRLRGGVHPGLRAVDDQAVRVSRAAAVSKNAPDILEGMTKRRIS